MQISQLLLATVAGLATTTSAALGINCRGSSLCSGDHVLSELNTKVQALPDSNTYGNGVHIACVGHICAFLQNISGTKTGAEVKQYVQNLLNHGCKTCGSDPTEPGNNVDNGELTVNYVSSP
ncbi:hypothetical protein VPNG_07270 [Cytospora leucostoma]|uniref:Killer toxin Kp4 domain-containing protein n=1 Tax=Cytospora leucostoma TaxID=1230097 RepID=A0A423WKE7_9PEZI|nr:hypothetical protein VPNG_07270 [Cytospora leucostoma]